MAHCSMSQVLDKYKKKLLIGKLEGSKEVAANQTFADISEAPLHPHLTSHLTS